MSLDQIKQRIVLFVDLDYFFAQCEEIRKPEIRKKPVVVCVFSGRTEDSGVVSTANYQARSFGVRSGSPIVLAKKQLSTSPEAVFLPLDSEFYQSVSEEVMEIIGSQSKIFEKTSVDEAFIDITSESHGDYGTAREIAENLKSQIKNETQLICSVGVAPNKLLAKMVAETKKPDGMALLKPDETEPFLRNMPIGKLIGVGPKIEAKMRTLDISTVGELARFPESRLSDTFGPNLGKHFKLISNGIDEDPVKERIAEQYSRIVTLKEDADSFSFSEQLRLLSHDISDRLRSAERKCRSVGIIYITNTIKIGSRSRTIERWTDSEKDIFEEGALLFIRLFSETEESRLKIRRVGLRVSRLSGPTPQERLSSVLTDYIEKA